MQNPKQLSVFTRWGTRNKTNVTTKSTLQIFVRGFHLHFGTCLNSCVCIPGTYSAQFGLETCRREVFKQYIFRFKLLVTVFKLQNLTTNNKTH